MASKQSNVPEISWTAPEFESFHRGPGWYLSAIIITLALLGFSIWQQNFLFAVFVVIVVSVLLFVSRQEPRRVPFKINSTGLFIDKEPRPWGSFANFSISDRDDDGFHDIILEKNQTTSLSLKIRVPGTQVDKIRKFLHNYLPEVEHEDSLIDSLAKVLKL